MINIHEIRSKQNIKSLFASVPQSLLIADRQSDPRNAYTDNALQANSIAINIGCLFFLLLNRNLNRLVIFHKDILRMILTLF